MAASAVAAAARRVDAVEVAEPFRRHVREAIAARFGGHGPLLVGLLANQDPAAVKYADWTRRACEADGIRYELRQVARTELEDALFAANQDRTVHGIIIYYPVFGSRPSFFGGNMDDYLRDSIVKEKDVEGLCHLYRYNLYHDVRYLDAAKSIKCILPCTPLAVVKVLEALHVYEPGHEGAGVRLRGKTVAIVNRSEIVGRPLAAMLANDGADVYSADISSLYLLQRGKLHETDMTLEAACRAADVVITGVPSMDYRLPVDWIRPNTVVVNVASFKNVDEDALLRVPGVKYVPQVGRVTVAMLERNLLRLYENFHRHSAASAASAAGALS